MQWYLSPSGSIIGAPFGFANLFDSMDIGQIFVNRILKFKDPRSVIRRIKVRRFDEYPTDFYSIIIYERGYF